MPALRTGDGSRGRQALAAGRQVRLRGPDGGDARAGLPGVSARRRRRRARSSSAAGWRCCVAAALEGVPAGGELEVRDAVARGGARAARLGADRGARGHVGEQTVDEAGSRRFVVRIRRGAAVSACSRRRAAAAGARPLADDGRAAPHGRAARDRAGALRRARLPRAGLIPLGALAEPGGTGATLAAERARRALGRRARDARREQAARGAVGRDHATSRGRRRAGCPTTSSGPSPR